MESLAVVVFGIQDDGTTAAERHGMPKLMTNKLTTTFIFFTLQQ
jgi:hypothetical protein